MEQMTLIASQAFDEVASIWKYQHNLL